MSRPDKALMRAVMRGWDAQADSPSESVSNICEAVAAHIRRSQALAWDCGYMSATYDAVAGDVSYNPYRGRARR